MAFMASCDDKPTPAHTVHCLPLCWVLCDDLSSGPEQWEPSSDPLPSPCSEALLLFLFNFLFSVCHTVFAYYLRVICVKSFYFLLDYNLFEGGLCNSSLYYPKHYPPYFAYLGGLLNEIKKVHKWINDFITGYSSLGVHFSHLSSEGVGLNDL